MNEEQNIVHVDFAAEKKRRQKEREATNPSPLMRILREIHEQEPWALRMLAVVLVLILSLLVL